MFRLLALVTLFVSTAFAASPEDDPQTTATPAVQFDDQTLTLAYEAGKDGETIKEFVPDGEKLESWTKLAAIRTYANLNDPMAMAAGTLKQLKNDYPLSPSSIIQNPKTGEVIIDFVVWPQDGTFVEFNIFKYQKGANGGLSSQQYALREYQDPEGFLKGLKPVRERLVEWMAAKGLQTDAAAQQVPQQKTGSVAK